MSIIVSKKGQTAQKLDRASFDKEDYLQSYIHENPESIPVYEIEEDKKLLVVAREFPTESGPIDALAIDKDGDVYIVETKLYKNPDKRTVVAQALDYGASLWKHLNDFNELVNRIEEEVKEKFHVNFEEKVKDFFGVEDIQPILDRMNTNFKDGNIKFVILMDSMDERLKDLIIYVNQNSHFDIYAVQLEYYKFNEYEIMIPKMFGVEVKKNMKSSPNVTKINWTKEMLIDEMKLSIHNKNLLDILLKLYDFAQKNADVVSLGTGKAGSFMFKLKDERAKSGLIMLFTLYCEGNESAIQLGFGSIKANLGEDFTKLYLNKLSQFDFLKEYETVDLIGGYSPIIYAKDVFKNGDTLEKFKVAIEEFTQEVKKH